MITMQQASIVCQILQALQGDFVLDSVLQASLNQLRDVLRVSCCSIYLVESSKCSSDWYISKFKHISLDLQYGCLPARFRQQIEQGHVVLLHSDPPEHKSGSDSIAEMTGINALMLIPLIVRQSYVGCLGLYECDRVRQWTVEEVDAVKAIAQYLALAIYQSKLEDQVQQLQNAEVNLRQRLDHVQQLTDNISDVLWIAQPGGSGIDYVSPAYEKILGRPNLEPQAISDTWLSSVHPDDQGRLIPLTQNEALQACEIEYRIVRPDQTIRWIRDRIFPIYSKEGKLSRIAGIAEDITNRKQFEEEAKLLREMTQAILECEDFHSAIQVALQKICETTNWSLGEAWVPDANRLVLECSLAWYGATDPVKKFREQSREVVFPMGVGLPGRVWQKKALEWQCDISTQSESTYPQTKLAAQTGLKSALGIPIVAGDEVLAVLVFYMFESRAEDERLIDLISASTELGLFIQRKRVESEIRKSLLQERELNQLKSDFISMVSHEFRTPLSSVVLSTELLRTFGSNCGEDRRNIYLHRIQTATERMTQLLEDVLFLGQSETGKLEFDPRPLDLEQFCLDLVEEFQSEAVCQHTITFVGRANCKLVDMDEKLLHHILANLLSNAIKYSPPGGMVQLELYTDEKDAILQVKDNGIGIPEADQQRLFEAFHRAANVGKIGGTGLGLSIVKQCVDLHGGTITLKSSVGVGTTFTVKLPLNQETRAQA